MSNLNNDSLFKQVLQAQETQREGWMADPVAELNQRLIDRQESFQAQLVRIEETWREKLHNAVAETNIYINQVAEAVRQVEASDALNRNLLVENREKDAEIDRLKKELREARKDAERLYLSIKDVEEPTYHELDIMKQHEALTGKPLSFG